MSHALPVIPKSIDALKKATTWTDAMSTLCFNFVHMDIKTIMITTTMTVADAVM